MALCLAFALSLFGCNAQSSATRDKNYKEEYTAGYEAENNNRKQHANGNQKYFVKFSGSVTAAVEQLLPDYYALLGKTIAVVCFFQASPFLLYFQKELTARCRLLISYRSRQTSRLLESLREFIFVGGLCDDCKNILTTHSQSDIIIKLTYGISTMARWSSG